MEQEYIDLITKLTNDFEKTVKSEEKEMLKEAFRSYLELTVYNIQNSSSKFIRKDFESVKRVLTKIAFEIFNMNVVDMKKMILEDKALGEIQRISSNLFENAKNKKSGKKVVVDFDEENVIKQMKKLLDNVAPYNIDQAQNLVSEAILDLKYLCQNEERVSSLRLYHYTQSMIKINDEEER